MPRLKRDGKPPGRSVFGDAIYQKRNACRYDYCQMSMAVRVQESSLRRWEIGAAKPPRDEMVELIAKFLKIDADELKQLATAERQRWSDLRNGRSLGVPMDVARVRFLRAPQFDSLGESILHFRELRGLSMEALSSYIGWSSGAIYRWETNRSIPTATTLDVISHVLVLDPNILRRFLPEEEQQQSIIQEQPQLEEREQPVEPIDWLSLIQPLIGLYNQPGGINTDGRQLRALVTGLEQLRGSSPEVLDALLRSVVWQIAAVVRANRTSQGLHGDGLDAGVNVD